LGSRALRTALDAARQNLAAGRDAWARETGDVAPRLNELLLEIFASTFNDPRLQPDR
jgi:hypothetical protein